MKKIRDIFVKAPLGFWGIDPNTGTRIDGNSYKVLKSKWKAHRAENNLPWQEVEQYMQDQICAREEGDYCVDSETGLPSPSLMAMAGSAIKSATVWMLHGAPIAAREEVERRSAICLQCPHFDKYGYNGHGKCTKCGCSGLKLAMETEECPDHRW